MVGDHELTAQTIGIFEKSMNQIESELIDLCVYMAGGITWETAWELGYRERVNMFKALNKKLKAQTGNKKEYM